MGLSLGEIAVLVLIGLVVIGPKDLPRILRAVGRFIGQARRALDDVRREAGLDDVLRGDYEDLVRLADHIEKLDVGGESGPRQLSLPNVDDRVVSREREYPTIGADSVALLSEDAFVYPDSPGADGTNADWAKPLPLPEGALAQSTTMGAP